MTSLTNPATLNFCRCCFYGMSILISGSSNTMRNWLPLCISIWNWINIRIMWPLRCGMPTVTVWWSTISFRSARKTCVRTWCSCFSNIDDNNENTYENIIKEYFGNLNVPIIYDFPTGHAFPFVNVPIGLKVRLDADKKTIEILEELYND